MTVRPIHLLGSPVLRERAREVDAVTDDVRRLVTDLLDTMRADKGIGLAANQVGETRRVAVVAVEDREPVILINPKIVEREGTARAEEGCLSVPEIYGEVDRAWRIVVETTDLTGARTRIETTDLESRAIQHEIDHLDGVLFIDRVSPLKRRMLLKKWQKLRKGQAGFLKEVSPATARS